jgi:hypothetical protein
MHDRRNVPAVVTQLQHRRMLPRHISPRLCAAAENSRPSPAKSDGAPAAESDVAALLVAMLRRRPTRIELVPDDVREIDGISQRLVEVRDRPRIFRVRARALSLTSLVADGSRQAALGAARARGTTGPAS